MGEGPGRDTRRTGVAGARQAGDAGAEFGGGALLGGEEVGVVGAQQSGLEHDLEVGGVLHREADVPYAAFAQVGCGGEGFGEESVPLGGEGGEEPGAVLEVVGGCGVGDARAAREVAQAERPGTLGGDDVEGGGEDGLPQVAVVVGAPGRHGGSVSRI